MREPQPTHERRSAKFRTQLSLCLQKVETDACALKSVAASFSHRAQPQPDDALDQLRVGQPRLLGRLREILVRRKDRIRVRLDEINFILRECEPQVKAVRSRRWSANDRCVCRRCSMFAMTAASSSFRETGSAIPSACDIPRPTWPCRWLFWVRPAALP